LAKSTLCKTLPEKSLFLKSRSLKVEGVTEEELPAIAGTGKINKINSNKNALSRRKYFIG
jgi:hypothetical protein